MAPETGGAVPVLRRLAIGCLIAGLVFLLLGIRYMMH